MEIQLLVQNGLVEFKKYVVKVQRSRLTSILLEVSIDYNHNYKDEPKEIDM